MDKVAFARAVVDTLLRPPATIVEADLEVAEKNLTALSKALTQRQRIAERAETVEKISSRINRTKRDFTRTHRDSARREDVYTLMEEIQSQLDNSQESEYVRIEMSRWETRFGLAGNPREKVEDYPGLVKAIRSLAYKGIRTASETDPAEPA